MAWVSHTLGSLNFNYTNPATDMYFVEDIANPPEEQIDEEYIALQSGAGARLARFSVGDAPLTLDVTCRGATKGDAEAAREAIRAEIDAAVNGTAKVWAYQEDATAPVHSWNIQGGRVIDRWRPSSGEQYFSLDGLPIAFARVVLHLSKN